MAIKTKQWRLTLIYLIIHKYNSHKEKPFAKFYFCAQLPNLSNFLKFLNLAKHSQAISHDQHSCLYINNSLKRKAHLTGILSFVLIFNGIKRKHLWLSQKPSKEPGGPLARKLGTSHPMLLQALPAYWP